MPGTSQPTHDYLNFEVTIRKEDDSYFARVTEAPTRRESEENKLTLPFKERDIPILLLKLENAVLRGAGSFRGAVASKNEQMLRDFGREMYKAVFLDAPDIRDEYAASLALVEQQQDKTMGLRLKLRVESPDLAALPWEFLYDKKDREFVCLRNKTPLVRFLNVRKTSYDLKVEGPLRILGMIANPGANEVGGLTAEQADEWEPLNTEEERHRIDEAIAPLVKEGKVQFQWVPGETPRHLLTMMRKQAWHVFHFIGHGGLGAVSNGSGDTTGVQQSAEGFIVLADDYGRAMEMPACKIYRFLEGHRSLRLAVLNCCYSARGTASDPFASPGAALVRAGIPAVVAMQYPVSDKAAIEMASGFYEALVDGFPVDTALTQARILVSIQSDIEWGVPVLYMRSPDGRLFSTIARESPEDGPQLLAASEQEGSPARPLVSRQEQEEPGLENVHPEEVESDPLLNFWAQIKKTSSDSGRSPRAAPSAVNPARPASTMPGIVEVSELTAQLISEIEQSPLVEHMDQSELNEFLDRHAPLAALPFHNQSVRAKIAAAYHRRAILQCKENPAMAEASIDDLSQAIALEPTQPQHLFERAKFHGRIGNYGNALADIDQAITADPKQAEYHWLQGLVHSLVAASRRQRRDYSLSIEAFTRAVDLGPSIAKFYNSRAGAYVASGQHDLAMSDINKAIELAPDNPKYASHREQIIRQHCAMHDAGDW